MKTRGIRVRFSGVRLVAVAACFLLIGGIGISFLARKKTEPRTSYQIDAVYQEEAKTLSCQMTVQYYNHTEEPLPCLSFNVPANAYRQGAKFSPVSAQKKATAYKNGESFGEVVIEQCSVKGKDVPFTLAGQDQTFLTVETGKISPRKTCEVVVKFQLSLANVWHRLGYTDQTVNLGNWFPILAVWENGGFYECVYADKGDPFYSEIADFRVQITLPERYVVAAGGRETTERKNGEIKHTFSLENARDFAMVFSADFSVLTKRINGVDVRYYFLKDPSPEKTLAVATESLSCYHSRFGAYQYPTLSVVETGFIEGGMEYPALVYVSNALSSNERLRVTAHEVAHQWWYGVVGVNQVERGWMDESLAEYSTAVFFEDYPVYGVDRRDLYNAAYTSYKLYFDVYEQLTGKTNAAMLRPLSDFLSEYEYVNLVYNKGFLLWETYRAAVGDKRFFRALSHFYQNNLFQNTTEESLFASLQKSGAGGCGLIQSFLDGSAVI